MKTSIGTVLATIFKHRIVRLASYIYFAYLILCMLVIMPALNWGTGQLYQQQTGRALNVGLITFNPFALSVTARDLQDNNPDGSLFWSTERLTLNLSLLQSILTRAYTLDSIAIDSLHVHPQILKNGRWNFADILQHQNALASTTSEPPTASENPIALAINKIALTSATLEFSNMIQTTNFHTRLDDIQFSLDNFSTAGNRQQDYVLRAGKVETGVLSVSGRLQTDGTSGELHLANIDLLPVWQYFKKDLNFILQTAQFNGQSQFDLQWKDGFSWSVAHTNMQLENTQLHSGKKDAPNAELSLTKFQLENISASSRDQLFSITNARLDGLQLSSWSKGSDSGLLQAFAFKNSASAQSNTASDSGRDNEAGWGLTVETIAVNDAAVDWKVGELNDHAFKLRELNLAVNEIDNRSETPANLKLSGKIDGAATLSVDGNFHMDTLDGDFSSSLQTFSLETLKPLLTPYLHADIFTGQMTANAELQIRNAELTRIISQGTVTNLKVSPLADAQEILTCANLNWSDAQIDLTAQNIDVPLVEVSGLDSRFIITGAGKTNFESLFPAKIATPDAAQTTLPIEEKPWSFALHKFVLEKSSFRFHDESLIPNFVAAVQNFGGTLTELTSDTSKPAQFKFNGDVDGYAPVNLQGKTQPFLAQPQLDAQLNFENIDLGNFSGYSSNYAGWKIERGLLSANLHYRLNKGLIVGDNHIEMDQLQLGERVENANSMDVPLRLALALITDASGVATLDINVSGNPEDPSFDIGKIIRAAFTNSINKIIKSPFKLLAKLAGSKEDLGYMPFNSGSPRLLATATRKLNALHQAMIKRPELRIELRGSYDQKTDYRGLQVEQIKPILLQNGVSNADIKAKNERWEKVVNDHYKNLDIEHDAKATADEKYERWLQTVTVTEDDLKKLAAARSLNAKQFLVQHLKLDSSRVLINSMLDCSEAETCSRRIVDVDLSDLSQIATGEKTAETITTP